ncbi:MAG: hypothetical protein KKF98_00220 [Bacteroidetes bacterium]|nr:hypothetical protein [Bacteroidota bacterium]
MRTRNTISILLSLLFSFPLLYQSLHYFEHLHQDKHDHHPCDQTHLSQSSELCAVCDYELAISDTPPAEHRPSSPLTFVTPVFFILTEKNLTPPLFYKSLRAPPTIS